MAAAAMRVLLEFNKVTVSVLGVGVNRVFSNPKHFAISPSGPVDFPGSQDFLNRYRASSGLSQINTDVVLYAYAAAQILAQAVGDTKTIDSEQLAKYIHGSEFETVVNPVQFDANGERTETR